MPKIQIHDGYERVRLSSVQENPRNARRHSAKQIECLRQVIAKIGFTQPILIDAAGGVIAGHGRVQAARLLGMQEVPAIRLTGVSKADLRAYAIFDNRITEAATWDEDILREEFGDLVACDPDFDVAAMTGFEPAEMDAILHGDDFGARADPADTIAPAAPARVAATGDVFQIGPHRLSCADALARASYENLLQGLLASVCITDPPYNVPIGGHVSGKGRTQHREFAQASGEMTSEEFVAFLRGALRQAMGVLGKGALIYSFMDGAHLFELLQAARAERLEQKALITWAKTNAGMGGLYRQQTEFIGVFKTGKGATRNNVQLGRYGRNRTTLWSYPGMNAFGRGRDKALALHPTVKPVAMLADAILDCTNRGDIVLDPFAGSASTLIAAHRTGRVGMGLELDPIYVDAALARLKAVTGLEPVRERDGAPWSDLVTAAAEAAL